MTNAMTSNAMSHLTVTNLATVDTSTLALALAAMVCLASFYVYCRLRRSARQRTWQQKLTEENRLRKL